MKRAALLLGMLMLAASAASAQNTGALSGWCNLGASQAQTQGLSSANYQQGIIPGCTVTVYLHGTTTLATIFSDGINTPLANPFTAGTNGQWTFYSALNSGVDVIGSGPPSGIPPNVYPAPVDLCIDCFASAQVTTPVGGPALETNGVANADQTYLDLDNGSGVIVTNTSGGHVNFAVNPSTLNPPQYQTAAANKTANSRTTSVTLASVNAGSRLIAFADSNTYNCLSASGQPYYPTITDTQGNIWTVDASAFSSYIGGNSGANMIVADATISASGSITITATQPNTGGTCATAYLTVAEYTSVVGVDVASVQACSLGCSGALAPSATAVTQNNELAVVLSETASGTGGATATPGSLAFSDPTQTWAYIWQFGALNVGLASTSTISNFSQNFPGAAIILLKSSLTFGTMTNPMYAAGQMIVGGTNGSPTALAPGSNGQVLQMASGAPAWQTAIASGSAYAFASYGSTATNSVAPSGVTTDAIGDINAPGQGIYAYCTATGMHCDGKLVTGAGAMTSGSAVLTDTAATFAAADVGKVISVSGAGAAGVSLLTTISSFTSATQVTLAATASTTVTTADVSYGTDDTTAFQALLNTVAAAGGGVIQGTRGKTSLISSAAINVPNTGTPPAGDNVYYQYPITIDGLCPAANGRWSAPPAGCFTLNMTFSPTSGAKINTYGSGELTIKNTKFEDTGADCGKYYLYTTNTTLYIQDNTFVGTGPGQLAGCSYGMLLGGTSTTIDNSTNAAFQGYHTRIEHNFFSRMAHLVDGQAYANAIELLYNTAADDCGSGTANDAYVNITGAGTGANSDYSWSIIGNLLEQGYIPYAFKLVNAEDNIFWGDGTWDATATTKAAIYLGAASDTQTIQFTNVAGGVTIDPASPSYSSFNFNDFTPSNGAGGVKLGLTPTFTKGWTLPDGQCIFNNSEACVYTQNNTLITRMAGTFTSMLGGLAFTVSGCSAGVVSGHSTGGKLILGANSCTLTVQVSFNQGATHGWSCWMNDLTAGIPIPQKTDPANGTLTFAVPAGAAASDSVNFGCQPY